MDSFISQVIQLVTTSPGNFVYHMVLAFSIAGALQGSISLWRDSEFPQGRRMVLGLSLLLGLRFILFIVAGLSSLSNMPSLLPVLERAVHTLSLLLIVWIWAFPEPHLKGDTSTSLAALFVLALSVLTWAWWGARGAETAFNATPAQVGWEILPSLGVLLGLFLLLKRRPNDWGYATAMLSIILVGHVLQLIFTDKTGDLPGIVRLFDMAAYPLLWTIPQRFNTPLAKAPPLPSQQPAQKPRRYGVEPRMFQAIMALGAEALNEAYYKHLAKTVSDALLADLCLIITPSINGQLFLKCGYDLIRETHIHGTSIQSDQVPMLLSAMKQARPLRLPASSTSQDLFTLKVKLNIGTTGHLLASFVPPHEEEDSPLGIVVLSPYSNRKWSRDDQAYLNNITNTLAPILHRKKHFQQIQNELETAQHNLRSLQNLLEETQKENLAFQAELEEVQSGVSQRYEEKIAKLTADQKEALEMIEQLQAEKQRLEDLIASLISQDENQAANQQLEEKYTQALQTITRLKKQIADLENKTPAPSKTSTESHGPSTEQMELFTSLIQELRQPMSSIVGYTDLLLGESVGILGALQRKFLDRIKASTERMESLLADLFQIVTLESGGFQLHQEPVDLGEVIDKAIADTRSQLQEKGISLRVDFPEEMPQIHADYDALQQVLIQLLKNAGAATPPDGEIFLRASIYQSEDQQDYVLMQVADQGGGIPPEDLPRVFSRLYRADNPLIQGVGDTGVGLSIVKTLVEAHNGRIWVDTEMGKGSTFSLLLPLSGGDASQANGAENPP